MSSCSEMKNVTFGYRNVRKRSCSNIWCSYGSNVSVILLSTVIAIILFNSNISSANSSPKTSPQNQKIHIEKNNKDPSDSREDKDAVDDDTPLEKDPHFLVWKILTKLLILTVLRATKRFWSPNFSTLVQCYGIYLVITLGMWLHICFDVFMEYVS